jgi:hypothetical protein
MNPNWDLSGMKDDLTFWPSVHCDYALNPTEETSSFISEMLESTEECMWNMRSYVFHCSQVDTQKQEKGCEIHFNEDILASCNNMRIFAICRSTLSSSYLWTRSKLSGKRAHSRGCKWQLLVHIPWGRLAGSEGCSFCWLTLHGHVSYTVTLDPCLEESTLG